MRFYIIHTYFFFFFLISDVHQPLSQIRMCLAGSLGTGQIILLSGIGATENTVRSLLKVGRVMAKQREYLNSTKYDSMRGIINNVLRYFTGCLCSSSRSSVVLSDDSFLLDARRGNLPLLACC